MLKLNNRLRLGKLLEVDSKTIDRINILQASLLAMKKAVSNLSVFPDLCLIDGKFTLPDLAYPQIAIVKGDSKSVSHCGS